MLAYAEEGNTSAKEAILNGLNEAQKEPVIDYKGASVIVAGPGSGKTHTTVARAAYMIEDGVDPKSMLMFTFTNKAAGELKERVHAYIGKAAKGITVGTYHSFCSRILRAYCDKLGWNSKFTIYDTEDVKKVLGNLVPKHLKVERVMAAISDYKDHMISPKMAREQASDEYERQIANIYTYYMAALKSVNAFDFDDLIYYTIRVFENFPEIQEHINSRYKYIMGDEAQDSSPRDLELIRRLGGDLFNVCLIMDDDQSIYGFRGSDVDKVAEFAYEHQMKQFVLGQNYRSTKTVVSASRAVISNNVSLFDKTIFTENEEGEPIFLMERQNQATEAAAVAAKIAHCIRDGYKYSDIAVLYRMSYLSRKVEEAFMRQQIPYRVLSGTPFYGRMEIKDLLSYLRFISNPTDQISFERAISVPKRGIGESSLNKILSCQDALSSDIMEPESFLSACKAVKLKGKAAAGLAQFVAVCEKLQEDCTVVSPRELVKELVQLLNYEKYLKDFDKETAEDRIGNINELINIAAEHTTLTEFLNSMSIGNRDDNDDADNAVTMMTMHASKGLEYPVVFVVGVNDGICPHWKAIESGDVPEERRLFYVAMTRAKKRLFITNSKTMQVKGTIKPSDPSRFLGEIPDKYALEI